VCDRKQQVGRPTLDLAADPAAETDLDVGDPALRDDDRRRVMTAVLAREGGLRGGSRRAHEAHEYAAGAEQAAPAVVDGGERPHDLEPGSRPRVERKVACERRLDPVLGGRRERAHESRRRDEQPDRKP
jgi:hypothetical protein